VAEKEAPRKRLWPMKSAIMVARQDRIWGYVRSKRIDVHWPSGIVLVVGRRSLNREYASSAECRI